MNLKSRIARLERQKGCDSCFCGRPGIVEVYAGEPYPSPQPPLAPDGSCAACGGEIRPQVFLCLGPRPGDAQQAPSREAQ
jgi:hypothetical protein